MLGKSKPRIKLPNTRYSDDLVQFRRSEVRRKVSAASVVLVLPLIRYTYRIQLDRFRWLRTLKVADMLKSVNHYEQHI